MTIKEMIDNKMGYLVNLKSGFDVRPQRSYYERFMATNPDLANAELDKDKKILCKRVANEYKWVDIKKRTTK